MKFGIIVQARLGSTRLPRKVLRNFSNGKPLIEVVLSNLQKVKGVKLIVATSVNHENDELVDFLESKGVITFRGSEDDVLNRFIEAAEANDVDAIVRICSDNPFLDWHGVQELIERATVNDADYIGYRINNIPSIKTHFGFWGEYVSLNALKRVNDTTVDRLAHEHVTIHVYSSPEEYKCEWIECPSFLQGRNDIRLTVDNEEDFNNAQIVYHDVCERNPNYSLEDVVKYIDEHNDLRCSMKQMIGNNIK